MKITSRQRFLLRKVVEAALPLLSSRDFLFDVDLLLIARTLGFRIVEVPTIWIDREGSRLRILHDSKRMAMSSLRLWAHHLVLSMDPAAWASTVNRSPAPLNVVLSSAEVALVPTQPDASAG